MAAACTTCQAPIDPARTFPALVALSGILAGPLGNLLSCGQCLTVLRVSISDIVAGMSEWPYHPPSEVLSSSAVHRILKRIEAAADRSSLAAEVAAIAADEPGRYALRIPEVFRLAHAPFGLGPVRLTSDAVYMHGLAMNDFVPSSAVGPPTSVEFPAIDRVSPRFLASVFGATTAGEDPRIGGFHVLRAGTRFTPLDTKGTALRLRLLDSAHRPPDGVLGFAAPLDLLAIDDAPL